MIHLASEHAEAVTNLRLMYKLVLLKDYSSNYFVAECAKNLKCATFIPRKEYIIPKSEKVSTVTLNRAENVRRS